MHLQQENQHQQQQQRPQHIMHEWKQQQQQQQQQQERAQELQQFRQQEQTRRQRFRQQELHYEYLQQRQTRIRVRKQHCQQKQQLQQPVQPCKQTELERAPRQHQEWSQTPQAQPQQQQVQQEQSRRHDRPEHQLPKQQGDEEDVPSSARAKPAKRSSIPSSVAPGTTPPERRPECDVCGDNSQRPHLNYVCFSCRAFFRRAHQQCAGAGQTKPHFLCRWGGSCAITVKSRRQCQKCRYLKCLQAGMRKECVLDLRQRRHRFRKAIRKRAATSGGEKAGSVNYGARRWRLDKKQPAWSSHDGQGESSSGNDDDNEEEEFTEGEELQMLPPIKRLKMRYYCKNAAKLSPGSKSPGESHHPRTADKSTSTDGLCWMPESVMADATAAGATGGGGVATAALGAAAGGVELGSSDSLLYNFPGLLPLSVACNSCDPKENYIYFKCFLTRTHSTDQICCPASLPYGA